MIVLGVTILNTTAQPDTKHKFSMFGLNLNGLGSQTINLYNTTYTRSRSAISHLVRYMRIWKIAMLTCQVKPLYKSEMGLTLKVIFWFPGPASYLHRLGPPPREANYWNPSFWLEAVLRRLIIISLLCFTMWIHVSYVLRGRSVLLIYSWGGSMVLIIREAASCSTKSALILYALRDRPYVPRSKRWIPAWHACPCGFHVNSRLVSSSRCLSHFHPWGDHLRSSLSLRPSLLASLVGSRKSLRCLAVVLSS